MHSSEEVKIWQLWQSKSIKNGTISAQDWRRPSRRQGVRPCSPVPCFKQHCWLSTKPRAGAASCPVKAAQRRWVLAAPAASAPRAHCLLVPAPSLAPALTAKSSSSRTTSGRLPWTPLPWHPPAPDLRNTRQKDTQAGPAQVQLFPCCGAAP